MATRYVAVECAWLKPWVTRFDASIADVLERQGQRLAAGMLAEFHRATPRFAETTCFNTLSGDAWPKYISKRLVGHVGAEKVAELLLEYVNHNPRDGETWHLQVMLWLPGDGNFASISLKDNTSNCEVDVSFEDGHPDVEARTRTVLARFDPGGS